MKILFASHGYRPAWRLGGPVISVPALAESLVALGHQVSVFTTNSNLDLDLDVATDSFIDVNGVSVRYFRRQEPLKRLFPNVQYLSKSAGTLYAPEMSRAVDAAVRDFDVVHTHLPFCYPSLVVGRAAIRNGLPLFYHQRGVLDPARLKFRGLKKRLYLQFFELPILRRVTTLIALTEAEARSYDELKLTAPCRVIPNGIHLPTLRDELSVAADLRTLGIDPSTKILLFLARLHPIKGPDRLLDAFLAVAEECPDWTLVLAGPDEFGVERDLRKRAMDAGLGARVAFPGMVSGSLKASLLQAASLFCLPSDAEGFSMAVLEALSYKTPVLLSPGCNFSRVEDVGAGLVVNPSVEDLRRALSRLLRLPFSLDEMGQRGFQMVSKDYGWESIGRLMVDAYVEGIARHRASLGR